MIPQTPQTIKLTLHPIVSDRDDPKVVKKYRVGGSPTLAFIVQDSKRYEATWGIIHVVNDVDGKPTGEYKDEHEALRALEAEVNKQQSSS